MSSFIVAGISVAFVNDIRACSLEFCGHREGENLEEQEGGGGRSMDSQVNMNPLSSWGSMFYCSRETASSQFPG